VTRVSAKDRGIGFVFQNYALFRQMTVADNVEFALRVGGMPAEHRRERREELLQLVGLSGFGDRYPRQLSGGQQQRVALARALAHQPRLLLLDEPFGALDAKIRLELRHALRDIQRKLGLTTVFVTHDQEEAFELADRIGVLHMGRLLEVGEPHELYLRPRSPFVATFLGAANLVVGESSEKSVRLGPVELPVSSELLPGQRPRRVQVLFRPEDVHLTPEQVGGAQCLGRGVVDQRTFAGATERLRMKLPPLPRVRAVAPSPPFGEGHLLVDVLRPQHESARWPLSVGDEASVSVRRFHVLAPAGLRFVVDGGDSPQARAAQELGEILSARMSAHLGRLPGEAAVLGSIDQDDLGAETERGAEGFDVAVLGLELDQQVSRLPWLSRARHHVLLVRAAAPLPTRVLVCVAVGEPGKADVRFAERFAWQLGASATVLTVLPDKSGPVPRHVERFMDSCVQMLQARGVVARNRTRQGHLLEEILSEISEGGHDLVIVGAPLEATRLDSGFLGSLLRHPPNCPVLIVRHQTNP